MTINNTLYQSMVKAGHNIQIVRSRIEIDFQVNQSQPEIEQYVELLFAGKEIPNDLLNELSKIESGKYNRLEKRGLPKEKVNQIKTLDNLYGKYKTTESIKIDPLSFGISSKGSEEFVDCVVNSSFTQKQKKTKSQKRAEAYKKEAGRRRIETDKNIMDQIIKREQEEEEENQIDIAPSTFESKQHPKYESKSYLKLINCNEAPIHENIGEFIHPIYKNKFQCFCLFPKIYRFDDFIPSEQCKKIIDDMNFTSDEIKVKESLLQEEIKKGRTIIRTSLRRKIIDPSFSFSIWEGIKNIVPPILDDGRRLAGIRASFNFYRYAPGEFFDIHVDGGYLFRKEGISSEFTFILYLNDCETGGSTAFCDINSWNDNVGHVKPAEGRLLVFKQKGLKHCGIPVESGYKYIIQGMVMYHPPSHGKVTRPSIFSPEVCQC